jgi:hypothetical protein
MDAKDAVRLIFGGTPDDTPARYVLDTLGVTTDNVSPTGGGGGERQPVEVVEPTNQTQNQPQMENKAANPMVPNNPPPVPQGINDDMYRHRYQDVNNEQQQYGNTRDNSNGGTAVRGFREWCILTLMICVAMLILSCFSYMVGAENKPQRYSFVAAGVGTLTLTLGMIVILTVPRQ